MSSVGFHEPIETLSVNTRDLHRAIVSLMEEREAIDWYQQRVDATQDEGLRAILAHNRDEEKEHAAMVLEWIRRHDPKFDGELRAYLFTEGPIAGREGAMTHGASDSGPGATIGSLKGAAPVSRR